MSKRDKQSLAQTSIVEKRLPISHGLSARGRTVNVRGVLDRLAQPFNVVVQPAPRKSSLCNCGVGSVRLFELIEPRRCIGCYQLLLQPCCATTARLSWRSTSAGWTAVDLVAKLT